MAVDPDCHPQVVVDPPIAAAFAETAATVAGAGFVAC